MASPTICESLAEERLVLEFVMTTIPQPDSPTLTSQSIIQALQTFGTPLRWAITAVDTENKTLAVEAVVIASAPK